MLLNKDIAELRIRSVETNDMSNWMITHTIDTLTTVNNKFDVLKKVNDLINKGIDKKNIFITDRSFLISTNYKTYFEKGNVLGNTANTIVKVANIGRIITMEYNEEIININCLLAYYKKITSILNRNLNCRLRGQYLEKSYNELFTSNLERALRILAVGAKQQVVDIYARYLNPDNNKMDKLIQEIYFEMDKSLGKGHANFQSLANNSVKKFAQNFKRFDRPILGIYHNTGHVFEIINADQMYKNGEESKNRIQLKSLSKNSPVLIALLVTGTMLGFLVYLAYRDHRVKNSDIEDNMLDIPQNTREVIENVLTNAAGEITYVEDGKKNELDPQVSFLAENNFNKLEIVINKKKVNLEIRDNI